MRIQTTTLGAYLTWYCFGETKDKSFEEVLKEILSYAFVDFWAEKYNIKTFLENYWTEKCNIIECKEGNGGMAGEHDVAIVHKSHILTLESIDYAFTNK